MQCNDLVNGLIECGSGIFCCMNIFQIIKDKELKGYSWVSLIYFTSWGIWNLYYYPSLHQVLSFIGGIFITIVNLTFLFLVFYYKFKLKKYGNV
jgi:hypothetical protein